MLKAYSIASMLFRLALGFVFIWFGYLAIVDPAQQAAIWIDVRILDAITSLINIEVFMRLFGIAEIIVGLAIALKLYLRFALLVGLAMILGIIVNLWLASGFNEIVLRDIVIATAIIYAWAHE